MEFKMNNEAKNVGLKGIYNVGGEVSVKWRTHVLWSDFWDVNFGEWFDSEWPQSVCSPAGKIGVKSVASGCDCLND